MEKKKVLFLVNPISGTKNKDAIIEDINEYIDKNKFEYEIVLTQRAGHATELTKEAVINDYDIVVAVGGDGTVNEVSKSLIDKDVALAIIPIGSGNGLARELKIPLDIEEAVKTINETFITTIDTASVNNTPFFNVSGIGFDSEIAWLFNESKNRGLLGYLKIIISFYLKYKDKEYKIIANGKEINTKAFLISIANGTQWGNNAFISPESLLNDGFVEICILKRIPIYMTPIFIYKLFNKSLSESKYLKYIKCSSAVIESKASNIHIDGEPFKSDNILNVCVKPLSLNVIIP